MEGEILEIQERLETITEEGTIYPTQKDGNVKWYVWKNGRREYLSKKNDKEIRNLVNKKYLELYLKDTIRDSHAQRATIRQNRCTATGGYEFTIVQ